MKAAKSLAAIFVTFLIIFTEISALTVNVDFYSGFETGILQRNSDTIFED